MNYLPTEKQKLAAAVTKLGCFRVVNHGIPKSLMADIRATVRLLLDMPEEVKLRNTENIISGTGYISNNAQPDMTQFYESFGIYNAASSEDVQAFCSLLYLSAGAREIVREYASKIHGLIMDIASKISDSLGLVEFSFQEWHGFLRLNHFKFTKDAIGSTAAVAHTDAGFVTIIQEDGNVGGFEIVGPTGNFETIDPVSDSFFINVGDMGKVWSNGRLHNVKHRVICKEGLERFSNVFFLLAPKNFMIQPQAEFIDPQHPKLYGDVNFKEYQKVRLASRSLTGQLLPFLPTDQATISNEEVVISESEVIVESLANRNPNIQQWVSDPLKDVENVDPLTDRSSKVKDLVADPLKHLIMMELEMFSVPVIDLVNYVPTEKQKLAAAVTELGCFRVVNHGIPKSLMADIRATVRSLLDMPDEVKLRNTENIVSGTGYIAKNALPDMTQFYESFAIYNAASSEDVQAFCSLLYLSAGSREIISEYASKIHGLIMDIASKISDSLGVVEFSFQEWHALLRLNHFNFTKDAIGSIAAVAHTDAGFVTIIQEDGNVGGFEIIGPTGNIETIDPVSDSFFINIGDMGKVWSNGRLHNVKHRVMCKEGLERFSNNIIVLTQKENFLFN
ncbi:hypothetical protein KFK09_014884 [Dendrobium nobile]|uniref:Fe2OG dioxygenase domain-containing protein n=1 Tax=Dendrobium nobile TaxID=94219 RepID=A0A8T3B4C4_DENNO|nr:hypothetical protein KFK09_014884 [Dendrobium nobile]